MNRQNNSLLSDEAVRTQWFKVPEFGLVLAYGKDHAALYLERKDEAQSRGQHVEFIGWPDGTTLALELPSADTPIDLDELVIFYRQAFLAKLLNMHPEGNP